MDGICLKEGLSGSKVIFNVLTNTCNKYPDIFLSLPKLESKKFSLNFDEILADFEFLRVNSDKSTEIASFMLEQCRNHFTFKTQDGKFMSLSEVMNLPNTSKNLKVLSNNNVNEDSFPQNFKVNNQVFEKNEYMKYVDVIKKMNLANDSSLKALEWLNLYMIKNELNLKLTGMKFVVFGSGAELSPTKNLLKAGADVLWLDVSDPKKYLGDLTYSGKLFYTEEVPNMMVHPNEVRDLIDDFSNGDAVHICMMAYKGGKARELILSEAASLITENLKKARVASFSGYVSPTTVSTMTKDLYEFSIKRYEKKSNYTESFFSMLGLLKQKKFRYKLNDTNKKQIANIIVKRQGCSYQGCQYIYKKILGEVYGHYGINNQPIKVSLNTAPTTRTKSMSHPIFLAAFEDAINWGLYIFEPEESRFISFLLIIHDLFNENYHYSQIGDKQLHGGIFNLKYGLEESIIAAAIMSYIKNPLSLIKLIKNK